MPAFPPLLRIDLSPVRMDTCVVETSLHSHVNVEWMPARRFSGKLNLTILLNHCWEPEGYCCKGVLTSIPPKPKERTNGCRMRDVFRGVFAGTMIGLSAARMSRRDAG